MVTLLLVAGFTQKISSIWNSFRTGIQVECFGILIEEEISRNVIHIESLRIWIHGESSRIGIQV